MMGLSPVHILVVLVIIGPAVLAIRWVAKRDKQNRQGPEN